MNLPIVWILSALLFAALLISLGFQPKLMNRLLGVLFLFAGIAGLLFYGYGYYSLSGGSLMTVVKTVFWVFCMFLGRNDIGTISKVPLLSESGIQIVIYLTHLLALYATASAVVTNVGARLIRSLNLLLLHHKKINLIFGVNDDTLEFAAKLQKQEKAALVFVDDGGGASYNNRILKMGGILMNDSASTAPEASFLRRIGMKPGKKELALYCLSQDLTANLRYAEGAKQILAEKGILPEQTSISLLTLDEQAGEALQASGDAGGFGSVLALEPEDLMARLLIREYPPCATMRFQENALAAENFEALVVGFGRSGQAVLRQLIMNGQFAGSTFHALVIAKDYSRESGSFMSRFSGLTEHYALDFLEDNARSLRVYEYLEQHIKELNYIAVCTGNDALNAEVSREYRTFLNERGGRAVVVECSRTSLTSYPGQDGIPKKTGIYTTDILCANRLDQMAMQINHRYHQAEGRTAEADWACCDYFSRQSCRASADYCAAFLAAAGIREEALATDGWPENPELLSRLAETEHLRWCAFHYCMGYSPMPEDVFAARAAAYRKETAETGSSRIRVGKDTEKKQHACLIPWEDLPALDQKELDLTGREVHYQQLDIDNVLLIPALLGAGKTSSHEKS